MQYANCGCIIGMVIVTHYKHYLESSSLLQLILHNQGTVVKPFQIESCVPPHVRYASQHDDMICVYTWL